MAPHERIVHADLRQCMCGSRLSYGVQLSKPLRRQMRERFLIILDRYGEARAYRRLAS